ncbi:mammalian cell entry protein [Mycobacterium alsense]|uniref:Mammalian cell entry protein n=1 Tax=Mycobacterium alsense TaxID=324058 RepID=A0ABD6P408_9MYCO|nr:MlaD family protein [Mycobacterium alsense]OBG38983.1 mammalian cell entry protein [Mycobacterium alsense]OBI94419.1 mammalian cell entry protein [Mycobacterium alsense]
MRRYRKPLIGVCVFVAVCFALTWTVFVTLQRTVNGATTSYTALFTDASGLKAGDEVRMAGVRVGRVDSVKLDGTRARVGFRVQSNQVLYGDTKASIVYQNIIGQRYVGLSLGDFGDPKTLRAGAEIPVEHTEPSFDISHLLNGFEPLFTLLNPQQVDNVTTAIVRALQGDTGSITTLIAETTQLAESFEGTDQILDAVLGNLDTVLRSMAANHGDLDSTITQTRAVFAGLGQRRDELVNSLDQASIVASRIANVVGDVQPDLDQWLQREPGFAQHFKENKQDFAYLGYNIPLLLKGMARFSQNGSYLDVYACDARITLFPRLTNLIPWLVRHLTPGNRIMHSPICR